MDALIHLPWHRTGAVGDRPALADESTALTYAEFDTRVDAAAEQLRERGVTPGSVVAIMLPNRVELAVAMVAAWRIGAAATPINPVFTASEADYQIADSKAVLVVTAGPGAPTAGRPALVVDDLRTSPRGDDPLPASRSRGEDTALLIYTSGSTGRPKGVVTTHANLAAMIGSLVEHLQVTPDDHCLLVLPMFHANAICVSVLTPLAVGARVSVLARFAPRPFLEAIRDRRPTFFSAVPTIYAHLVAAQAEDPVDVSSLRVVICGAAPASAELLEATERTFGCPLIEGYGLTEGTCASTATPLDGARKVGTVGRALPGQTVAIMGPGGTLLPAGERGEVVIQGPNVMRGYLNKPDATAEALGDGWLHTGDVGILDPDGYLRIVDRIKDMIIRGGENIYPKEIETVLHTHPAVMEAAVVGAPHEVYGEVPVAYVAAFPDQTVTAEELTELARAHLTKIKIPVAIHLLSSLPKNPVGKIDKPALRASVTDRQLVRGGA